MKKKSKGKSWTLFAVIIRGIPRFICETNFQGRNIEKWANVADPEGMVRFKKVKIMEV